MKKLLFAVAMMAAIVGCSKENSPIEEDNRVEESARITLNVAPSPSVVTRAAGSGHGVQSDDNYVKTLDVFVFASDGKLDTYKKFDNVGTSLGGLQLTTKTGSKKIHVIANSHISSWTGVTTLTEFEKKVSNLKSEGLKSFTMTGSTDAQISAASNITVTVNRLASRIKLNSIKTSFAGTPYAGKTLSNVKVYLTNAYGTKSFMTGENPSSPLVLNKNALVVSDTSGFSMNAAIAEVLKAPVGDAGETNPHYFYCYENLVAAETSAVKFTRLVIQGDLDGTTYYYPIQINRENYGYVASNGHKGVRRNTSYTYNVVINRPGSLSPSEDITLGTISLSVSVANWTNAGDANINF